MVMILGTTGHRQLEHPAEKLVEVAIGFLTKLQPSCVITGMALGWDTLMAEVCFHIGIPFIAAIPFVGQESKWSMEQQKTYRNLLEFAQEVKIVSEGRYATWKLFRRNEWIVEQSDVFVGYVNPEKLVAGISGSSDCYHRALQRLGQGRVRNCWLQASALQQSF